MTQFDFSCLRCLCFSDENVPIARRAEATIEIPCENFINQCINQTIFRCGCFMKALAFSDSNSFSLISLWSQTNSNKLNSSAVYPEQLNSSGNKNSLLASSYVCACFGFVLIFRNLRDKNSSSKRVNIRGSLVCTHDCVASEQSSKGVRELVVSTP